VVRDQIRDKLPYIFEDIGEHSVKNIARPVRAYAMGAIAIASLPAVSVPVDTASTSRGLTARVAGLIRSSITGRRAPSTPAALSSAPTTSTQEEG